MGHDTSSIIRKARITTLAPLDECVRSGMWIDPPARGMHSSLQWESGTEDYTMLQGRPRSSRAEVEVEVAAKTRHKLEP